MSLQDIQIRIIMGVQGSAAAATNGLRDLKRQQVETYGAVQQVSMANIAQQKSWAGVINLVGQAERKYDGIYRAAYRVSYAGRQLQSVGMGIIGMLKQSADAWGEYEFMLNRAAGAMEVFDKTSEVYQHLKTGIMDLTRELRLFPAQDVAKAVYYWQSTTGQQIKTLKDLQVVLGGVKTAMQVAAMTQTDFEAVIKGSYSIMRQYGMKLTDIPNILKVLFLETQRTSLEFGDLIQSFKFVGPIAHALGGSFQDVAKWLGIIGDLGQRGSMSGRGLGMMFTQIVRPTAKAKSAFNDLYLKIYGVANAYNRVIFPRGKFVGFEKYVTILAKATSGLTQQQRLQYVTSIVGTQNSARIIVPLIEAQIKALRRQSDIFKESKYSAAGAAKVFEQAWGLLADSWKGVTGLLQETVEPIILLVGERIAKALTPFVKQTADVLNNLRLWLQENPAIVDTVVNVLALAGAFATALGSLLVFTGSAMALYAALQQVGMMIVVLVAPFVMLAGLVALVGTAIRENWGGIADEIGHLARVVGDVISSITGGFKDFQTSNADILTFLSGPLHDAFRTVADAIHWVAVNLEAINKDPEGHKVILAVAQAVVALAAASTALRAAGMIGKIVFGGLIGLKLLMPVFSSLILGLTGIKTVLGIAGGAFTVFSRVAVGALTFLVAHPVIALIIGIAALLFAAWQTNFLGIRDVVGGVVDWLKANLAPTLDKIGKGISDFATTVSGVLSGVVAPILDKWPRVVAFLQGIVDKLGATWGPVLTNIANTIAGVWNNIVITVGNAINQVAAALGPLLAALGRLGSSIHDFVGPAWDFLVVVVGGAVGFIIKVATELLNAIAPVFQGIVDLIVSVLGPVIEGLVNTVANVVTQIIEVLTGFVEIVTGIIDVFTALLTGNWDKAWQGVKNIVVGVFDVIKAVVEGALRTVGAIIDTGLKVVFAIFETIFGLKPGSIYDAIRGFLGTILGFGRDIITSLWNGISSLVGWLIGVVSGGAGIVGAIVNAIVSIPGKLLQLGKDIVTNLWNGILSLIPWLTGFLGFGSGGFLAGIISTLGGLPGQVWNIGKDVVTGLWNGILAMKDWIINKLWSFVRDVIPGPIKDALGISSPSKVTAELGAWIIKGLAEGITSTSDAYKAMSDVTSRLGGIAAAGASDIGAALTTAISGTSSVSLSSDTTRTIRLEVSVTSPDGSVSQLDAAQIASLMDNGDLVRALEHMATVN